MEEALTEKLKHVRPLMESDRTEFLELISSRMKELERTNIDTKAFLYNLDAYFNEGQTRYKLWGAFDDSGTLLSTIGSIKWENMPFMTLGYMFVQRGTRTFNSEKNRLVYCLHKCLEDGEQSGIKAYFSLQKTRTIKHKARSWRRYDTPLIAKYYVSVVANVPANTVSKYSIVREMMDMQTWPFDTTLWTMRLKPQHEPDVHRYLPEVLYQSVAGYSRL